MNAGPKTETRLENLKKILGVNARINSTLDLDELLGIIMTTAAEVMRSETASLMLVDESTQELVFRVALGDAGRDLVEKFRLKMGEGIAGYVAQSGEAVIVNDPEKDARFAKRVDKATGFKTQGIICVPMKSRDKIIGVIQAINPVDRATFKQEDLELFEAFADQATLSVENARLHTVLVEREKNKRELQIAHDIQQNFLPDLNGEDLGVEIAAKSLPALDVGGDFYDVLKLSEDQTAIVIGDVSGKGVPAALYMVRTVSDFRYLAPQTPCPAELMKRLNNRLADKPSFGMFVTLLYVLIDHRGESLTYSCAGHHPLLMKTKAGGLPIHLESTGGMPLGLMPDAPFEEAQTAFVPGNSFILYTDGVTEARNKTGEEYGSEKLIREYADCSGSAEETANLLIASVEKFSAGMPRHDDTTLVAVKYPEK